MKMPSPDTLAIAIAWLECNEGNGGEAEACAAVALWLHQHRESQILRDAARDAGVPLAALRKRIRQNRGTP